MHFRFLRKSPNVDENTHLEAFLTDETWDEYLAKMAMDGQWGDDIILKGISELTGRRIIVYSSFMSKTELTPTNLYEKDELYIGHIKSLMHFVSLRPYYWESLWALSKYKTLLICLNFLTRICCLFFVLFEVDCRSDISFQIVLFIKDNNCV